MTDISKLTELAGLFEVTIDELLGEHSEIVNNVVNGDMKGLLPFVRSHIIDKLAMRQIEADNYDDLHILSPFLSHDYLNNLAQMAIKKEGIQSISNIIPFLDSHILSEYIEKLSF